MNRILLLLIAVLAGSTIVSAQKKDSVLLTIDGSPVYSSDFKRVYNKNLDLVKDEKQKTVDGYLDLFIDYQLKLKESYTQGLDKTVNYKREFERHQEQLSREYLYDDNVAEGLAREAYDRGLEEVEASHILITVGYEDLPQDTLAAYNKLVKIRERALNGEDFTELAKMYSQEPSADEHGGYLGYFSAFTMVYPFENMAYNTKVGDVSEIVRTQFGYHIIKVHDRRDKSMERTVSHIMVLSVQDPSVTFVPEERINMIYKLLQEGQSFDSLAAEYSDDTNSKENGGRIKRFNKGDLRSPLFEEAAFALKKPGDISKPIQSEFGWHIIRLDETHEIPSFEEEKAKLEKRVKSGDRSKVVTSAVYDKIKSKYGYVKGDAKYAPFFESYMPDTILERRWDELDPIPEDQNKFLFSIGDKKNYFSDFANYIKGRLPQVPLAQDKVLLAHILYNDFEIEELKKYFRKELEKENEEYASVIREYKDGLLIFDLMDINIWSRARKDSTGLRQFYEMNKSNYIWKDRADVNIISCISEEVANTVIGYFESGKDHIFVQKNLNLDKVQVLATSGLFEENHSYFPKGFEFKKGVSRIYPQNDRFIVVNVKDIVPPVQKKFEEVRGEVMSDYQQHLEKQWIEELRKKYTVDINTKTLNKIKKELGS